MTARYSLLLFAAGAAGFAAGVLFDRHSQDTQTTNPTGAAHTDVSHDHARVPAKARAEIGNDAVAEERIWSEKPAKIIDIAAQLRKAMASTDAFRRMSKILEMADALTADEMPAAVAAAGKLPPGSDTNGALGILFARWGRLAPQAALAFALQMHDAGQRNLAIQTVVQAMAEDKPAAAFDLFNKVPPDQRPNVMWTIFPAWARSAPDVAAMKASQMPDGDERNNALLCVASQWASADPEAAIAWILSLPDGSVRDDTLMKAVCQNPVGAADMILDFPPGELQRRAINQIAIQWAQENLEAALAWAAQLAPGNARQEALASVATEWGTRDAAAAAAAAYAAQLPAGDAQERALRNVMTHWAADDSTDAAAWLDEIPAGAARDVAVAALTSRISPKHPETAAAWAQTISDESMRNTEVEQIVRNWMRFDENAARTWLARATAVAPDVKRRLLHNPRPQMPSAF
jgi:hypothetical protein